MSPKVHTPKNSEFVHGCSVESGGIHGIHGIPQEKVGDCKVLQSYQEEKGEKQSYHLKLYSYHLFLILSFWQTNPIIWCAILSFDLSNPILSSVILFFSSLPPLSMEFTGSKNPHKLTVKTANFTLSFLFFRSCAAVTWHQHRHMEAKWESGTRRSFCAKF